MFGIGVVELLLLMVVLGGGLALLIVALVRPRRTAGANQRAVRESRIVMTARVGGFAAGLVAAVTFMNSETIFGVDLRLGLGQMLAPVVFGLFSLLGITLGELFARPASTNGPRSATLTPRRVRDYLPTTFVMAITVTLVAAVAVLIFTTATASADDMGRAGRQLSRACSTELSSGRGPYPGSYYSIPLLIGFLLSVALASLAARQIVRRPRGAMLEASQDALRRRSLAAVTAGLGLAVAVPLSGVCVVASLALLFFNCPADWFHTVGWLILIVGAGSVVMSGWSLAVLFTTGSTVVEPERVQSDA